METREEYLARIKAQHPERCRCGDLEVQHGEKTKKVDRKDEWSATACWVDKCPCIKFELAAVTA